MKTEQFTKFIKDMSKATKRVATNPDVLGTFANAQVSVLQKRIQSYGPLTMEGKKNRDLALEAVTAELAERAKTTVLSDLGEEVGRTIAEDSVVLELHIRQPGFTKKIDSETFLDKSGNNGKVDSDILHVHQDLIDKKNVKAIMDHRARMLDYIRAWEVPGGMLTLGGGQFLVPLSACARIDQKISEFGVEREALLDKFEADWDGIVKDAKVKRGVFFNPNDYPPFSAVRDRFTYDSRYISNTVPDELKKAGNELYIKEHERRMLECAATAAEIQAALREGFHGLLEHFTDRLGVDEETGKPKRFNEKRITDIKDFLETFQARNLTNDAALSEICEKARGLLDGVDAATIRKDDDVRASLKQAFDELTEATDGLIEVRARKVRVAGA